MESALPIAGLREHQRIKTLEVDLTPRGAWENIVQGTLIRLWIARDERRSLPMGHRILRDHRTDPWMGDSPPVYTVLVCSAWRDVAFTTSHEIETVSTFKISCSWPESPKPAPTT